MEELERKGVLGSGSHFGVTNIVSTSIRYEIRDEREQLVQIFMK